MSDEQKPTPPKAPDENDRLRDGTISPNAFQGTKRVQLQAVKPDDKNSGEPQDVRAEISLVGALLWAGSNQPDLLRVTAITDLLDSGVPFYDRNLADIFDACVACLSIKAEHDPVAVSTELAKTGKQRPATSHDALMRLLSNASTVSERQARIYAESIRSMWAKRCAIHDLRLIIEDARSTKTTSEEIFTRAQAAQQKMIERTSVAASTVSVGQSAQQLFIALQSQQSGAMSTGLVDVDAMVHGGLRAKEVVIVAARTSIGKSQFAAGVAEHIVDTDPSAAAIYITTEMTHQAFTARLIAGRANIPMANLRNLVLNKDQWSRIAQAVADLKDKGLYFADSRTQTMQSVYVAVQARARALDKTGRKIKLVVIDRIDQIKPSAELLRKGSREQQVAETSRALGFIASEVGCAVIGIAQIHRDAERQKASESVPKLWHLRESGSIEMDADQVLILHRPRDPNSGVFIPGKPTAVVLAKERMTGETAATIVDWRGGKYVDVADGRTFQSEYGKDGGD